MIYRDFKGTKLSMLGFGTMRLPVLENGQIDTVQTQEMVDYATACRTSPRRWWAPV